MSLTPGTRVGPYEVTAPIGAGGMGEVYRAHDSRLGRDVALKVLPENVARHADRLARFEREAHVLAALNHPHIAALYGLEETEGRRVLVMELVDGHTLSDLINPPLNETDFVRGKSRRPGLPVGEALAIARQIADALEAAHAQGIIHRDLKPANVKVRDNGTVKVLDFGLAKEFGADPTGAVGPDVADSPTITLPETGTGMILGTAPYMAPEQARGKSVDKRADVWAFGCVLYEMLAGQRAFGGDDATETVGAVIHKDPDWTALPAHTPASVRSLLQACLQKDRTRRLRDLGDARLVMDGAFATTAEDVRPPRSGWARALRVAAVAGLAALATGSAVWLLSRPEVATPSAVRFQVSSPGPSAFAPYFALSPDGRHLAFTAYDQGSTSLWIHSFESGQSRALPTTGSVTGAPFWSPDSRAIGFVALGRLRRVDLLGGVPEDIGHIDGYAGGAWGADETMLVGSSGGVVRVPAAGGEPQPLTEIDAMRNELMHAQPVFLPDGRRFLYVRVSTVPGNSGIFVGAVDLTPADQSRDRLVSTGQGALYARGPDGLDHLLYLRDQRLLAHRIDPDTLSLIDDAHPIAEDVAFAAQSFALASVSDAGVLAYRSGQQQAGGVPTWINRDGSSPTPMAGAPAVPALYPRISPGGRHVALVVGGDVWTYPLDGSPPTRLTFDHTPAAIFSPSWTPDGRRVVYEPTGSIGLRAVAADGSTASPDAVSPAGHFHLHDWTPDGEMLVARPSPSGSTGWDILRLAPSALAEPVALVETGAAEGFNGVVLSPDARWLAYASDQTGTSEVWVRPYAGVGSPVRVSPNGGSEPVWTRDGRELLYREGNALMSVAVAARESFAFAPPTRLFETTFAPGTQPPTYDVAPDGRFLVIRAENSRALPTQIVLNWTALLPAEGR